MTEIVFNFGKYKGQPCTDMKYILWVFLNVQRDDIDYHKLASIIYDPACMFYTHEGDRAFDYPLFAKTFSKLNEFGMKPKRYITAVIAQWEVDLLRFT